MNKFKVGEGNVMLLKGGELTYTDVAAKFVRSEQGITEIIASEYDANLLDKILKSNHLACTEFDYFLFAIEGYARVTEVQLVRKRMASFMMKSGRPNKNGKRNYDVVLPSYLYDHGEQIRFEYMTSGQNETSVYDTFDLLNMLELWYNQARKVIPEEEARYLKPQATEFKALIGMNAHALLDWFKIRCCINAQTEIRDLAMKMLAICKKVSPDLFKYAGSSCKSLGYCPENSLQHKNCQNKIPTHECVLDLILKHGCSN